MTRTPPLYFLPIIPRGRLQRGAAGHTPASPLTGTASPTPVGRAPPDPGAIRPRAHRTPRPRSGNSNRLALMNGSFRAGDELAIPTPSDVTRARNVCATASRIPDQSPRGEDPPAPATATATATATIVCAIDSFKGSLPAAHATSALWDGWRAVRPRDQLVARPMADGGEGTLAAFATALPEATRIPIRVTGPAGVPVDAHWLFLPPTTDFPGGRGVVELASTSGIELLGDERRPWDADTSGFGQAIVSALDAGVSQLILGIGSSASTDGGTGILSALGARFRDRAGQTIQSGARGLESLSGVDLSELRRPPTHGVLILSDVRNPLTGPTGAAHVFGAQKGFTPGECARVDALLVHFAKLLGVDPRLSGAGAAGGTGAALLAWGGELVEGSRAIGELIGIDTAIAEASLVITGEGSFDRQSAGGKVASYIAARARHYDVDIALVAGHIADDANLSDFVLSESLTDLAGSQTEAITHASRWLTVAGARMASEYSRASRGRRERKGQ